MQHIDAQRTPDERFKDLPDFPFEPHYVDSLPGYEGLRVHYLDLGPHDARQTFLCLHGEPTWSYLYRKMIPALLESGARVLAPDLLGFGRSDKPVSDDVYTFHFHRNLLLRFAEHLSLTNITLVGQDWGASLGLTLPVDPGFRSRLARLFLMNTVMATGEPLDPHYYEWRQMVRNMPDLPIGQMIAHITPQLTEAEIKAYDAPFPDVSFKGGARTFPELAMVEPQMDGVEEARAAMRFWSEEWSGPSFMAIGAKAADSGAMQLLRQQIKGCPEPLILEDADHFVPEWGEPVALAALKGLGDL